MIGSRKITPPKILRIVPFGDFHISLRLNSFTRASSGVIVAHLTPTPCVSMAFAASIRHLIPRCVSVFDGKIEIKEVEVEIRMDQLAFDQRPDDAGHFIAVEFDDRIFDLDFAHPPDLLGCAPYSIGRAQGKAGAAPESC